MGKNKEIYGTVFENGSATLLARVVNEGRILTHKDIKKCKYTIRYKDNAITGHENISIDPNVIINLTNDDWWDVDQIGYNFCHIVDTNRHQAFPLAHIHYDVIFTLTTHEGDTIYVKFNLQAIP